MKVLNLRCANGHGFEGWFASDDAFTQQCERTLVQCPVCGDHQVTRMPTAPRLNLSSPREPEAAAAPVAAHAGVDLQSLWLQAVRHVMDHTVDVGRRFAEEARRMHYGEAETRGIRGQATDDERAELLDEGIEFMQLPLPKALDGPTH